MSCPYCSSDNVSAITKVAVGAKLTDDGMGIETIYKELCQCESCKSVFTSVVPKSSTEAKE